MGIKFPVFQYLKKIIPEKTIPGYLRPRDGVDEYSRLLHQFGLDDAATDDEIKQQYRRFVKEYHPDTNPDPARVEQFIKLKATYEKILAMRKNRFGN
ncbi:DnaJ domain-containing protein [bacterium]|nr:DnaJ domain-containing protein [bacterium]